MYQRIKKHLCILMVIVLAIGILPVTAYADPDITADFECPNFLAAVRALPSVPDTGPILASHVDTIDSLSVWWRSITSLAGIEHFAQLRTLDAHGNQITSADFSSNPELTWLRFDGNALTAIDVSGNPALTTLILYDNALTAIDVSGNPALTSLNVGGNALTAIDVSGNPALTSLNVGGNALTAIDVSGNPALTSLTLSNNALTAIDLSGNPALTMLHLSGNALTAIDLSGNPALTSLVLNNSTLTAIDVSGNPALFSLSLSDNALTSIDLSGNPALNTLWIDNNALTAIDVSGNPALLVLRAADNALTSIDVSGNRELYLLWLNNNALTSVDVSNNRGFGFFGLLHVYENLMTSPDDVIGWSYWFNYAGSTDAGDFRFFPQRTTAAPPTAPSIISANTFTVQYGAGGTFQVTATGTAPVTFALENAPAGVSINGTSGLITVAPNALELGVHTFRIVASGAVAPDYEQTFTLTVTNATALHSVTILGGGAGASATPNPASVGERINLHAGQAPSGQVFQNWTVSPSAIALTNATSPTAASFEMIDAPVEVTANWRNATTTQPSARPPASGGGGWAGNIIIRPGGTPPVQPAPPTPVTPEILPDIVTAVVYPDNATHVHTVVQNQISAGVNNIVLALPTGYSAVSVTASTLQAIAAASVNLTVVVDSASVTIPVAALPNIIQQGSGDFDINVGTVAIDIGISVDVSISSGGTSITNLSAPISVDVVLEDIGSVNHHRIVAILNDGTLVGGSFNPASGAFTFDTEITGEFIITYVENLNRLVLQIGGTTITCLAGNAQTQFMDVAPVIQDGRTLLPVRFMAYALNAEVDWTPETDTSPLIVSLNLDGTPLSFGIGEITPELAALGMDVPAQIISNRTMVPLRFISEFFGAVVTWDDATRTVQIIKG